jgi:hypothetical protein
VAPVQGQRADDGDVLSTMPQLVREMSLAAVGAARARESLSRVNAEIEALHKNRSAAVAALPERQAAALTSKNAFYDGSPSLLEVRWFKYRTVEDVEGSIQCVEIAALQTVRICAHGLPATIGNM